MTTRRLLAMVITGCFAATAAAVAVVAPSPASATQSVDGERSEILTVSPARQLFNVTLHPGEQARAVAKVRNGSSSELALAVTPIVAGGHGLGDGADALFLSSSRTGDCSAESMRGTQEVSLAAAMPLPQGTITPGSTIDLCVQVSYPEAHTEEGSAVSIIDLAFTGIERGSPGGPHTPDFPDLVGTGASSSAHAALLLGAVSLLTAGVASLLRHPRRTTPAKGS